jgi:hypothetical protein
MWLSEDLTIQGVAKGGGRSELRRSIGSKLHATQNDLALPVDDCYWPKADFSKRAGCWHGGRAVWG